MFLCSPVGRVAGQEQRSLLAAFQSSGIFLDNDHRKSKSEKVDIGSPCLSYIFVDILADLWDLKYNEFTSTSFQVFGPEISTYFTDPYTFLHFEV